MIKNLHDDKFENIFLSTIQDLNNPSNKDVILFKSQQSEMSFILFDITYFESYKRQIRVHLYSKEVLLSDILNLKKENIVFNIEQGYIQSMLKIKGYLQLDQHNSTRWDYALTTNETYTKNDTQYIQKGLYFKNDVGNLEDFLIDYEVEPGLDNRDVYVFGIIYDWNPNRKTGEYTFLRH
ncbi:Two-component system response regulator, receiver domain [Acholeplasma oculi]|uniref:Two-component system response regulator, receiver domain n=1 Tax=Acholeplasma oculi TaxID=35623 RepID=A0A061AAN2_9MOLU|nr:hypothetical protein [Acholeplasma oculi]CDR30898.1 Two-component system response regulator, receiver domain [Acholeplasma oculi]